MIACGTTEAADPRGYILDRARSVQTENYRAMLSADDIPTTIRRGASVEEFKASVIDAWEEESYSLERDATKVEQVLTVDTGRGMYYLVSGDVDFGQLEDSLPGVELVHMDYLESYPILGR